jgi:hypothetical protein
MQGQMSFTVTHDQANQAAVLTHKGQVDAAEIEASRIALKDLALEQGVRGAIIDIIAAEITASPVEIIPNVEGLARDLRPDMRLAFVARPEDQNVVSMLVTTVAHSSGIRVGGYDDLDKARCWIRVGWEKARECGCLPLDPSG